MEDKKQLLIRAAFIGESNIGKTSLILREVNNTYSDQFVTTIGLEFWVKSYNINGENIKGQLWDSSSFQRRVLMRGSVPTIYRKINAFGLCFDLSNRATFDLIKQWTPTIRKNNSFASCFLIGCKSDMEHIINEEEITKLCQLQNLVYLQTSSKENTGVNEAFLKIMEGGRASFDMQKLEEANPAPVRNNFSFCKT